MIDANNMIINCHDRRIKTFHSLQLEIQIHDKNLLFHNIKSIINTKLIIVH